MENYDLNNTVTDEVVEVATKDFRFEKGMLVGGSCAVIGIGLSRLAWLGWKKLKDMKWNTRKQQDETEVEGKAEESETETK